MKLRNKKTGEIQEYVELRVNKPFGETIEYTSLSEFVKEWEDYKPKEPLIKDEKIRKAVRAWAEANDITRCHYEYGEFEQEYGELRAGISFGRKTDYLEERLYTIAELCGEEEE